MEHRSANVEYGLPEPPELMGFADAPPAPLVMERAIVDGLPSEALRNVARAIWPDPVEATRLIHAVVPKSSLSRRGTLTQQQGEQTERLARLFSYAARVLGSVDDARGFMQRPHPELDGRRPVDACLTELGGRAVERVLDSIAYGLPVQARHFPVRRPQVRLWRIGSSAFPVWSAEGARLRGGRWNRPGTPAIYAATSYASAVLEVLVHSNIGRVSPGLRHVAVDIPDNAPVEALTPDDVPGWDAIPAGASCEAGDRWLRSRAGLVLLVPSVVTGGFDHNAVVNPLHPLFPALVPGPEQKVFWDRRLLPPVSP